MFYASHNYLDKYYLEKNIKSCVTYESILKCPLDDAKIFI